MERLRTYRYIRSGRKIVTTAGTPVQLESVATRCKLVVVVAESNNTEEITIGGSNVVGALATRKGEPIEPGATREFFVDDVSKLWMDSIVSTEGCTFNIYN